MDISWILACLSCCADRRFRDLLHNNIPIERQTKTLNLIFEYVKKKKKYQISFNSSVSKYESRFFVVPYEIHTYTPSSVSTRCTSESILATLEVEPSPQRMESRVPLSKTTLNAYGTYFNIYMGKRFIMRFLKFSGTWEVTWSGNLSSMAFIFWNDMEAYFSLYFACICAIHTSEISIFAIAVYPSSYISSLKRELPQPMLRMFAVFFTFSAMISFTPEYRWYQSNGSGSSLEKMHL